MEKKDLILYEMPRFVENISIGWIQSIIAKFIARKVNRKFARYQSYKAREEFFNPTPPNP